MRDLRRLLKYLLPHSGTFAVATFAMIVVGVLESAMGALIVPIFDQAFAQGAGHRTPTLFGLQRIIPASGGSCPGRCAARRTCGVVRY